MKLSTLMIIKAAVCIALGAVILIAPGWLYNLFGAVGRCREICGA